MQIGCMTTFISILVLTGLSIGLTSVPVALADWQDHKGSVNAAFGAGGYAASNGDSGLAVKANITASNNKKDGEKSASASVYIEQPLAGEDKQSKLQAKGEVSMLGFSYRAPDGT